MSLAELAGRSFAPTGPHEVTDDRVAEFAAATGASYDGGAAPVTFPIVVAFEAIRALVEEPTAGLTLARIVHGEQRFAYRRPVRPGDVLTARLTVESVRSMGGSDIIRTVTDIADQEGETVVTAWATLIHRAADPADGSVGDGPRLPPPRTSGEAS